MKKNLNKIQNIKTYYWFYHYQNFVISAGIPDELLNVSFSDKLDFSFNSLIALVSLLSGIFTIWLKECLIASGEQGQLWVSFLYTVNPS